MARMDNECIGEAVAVLDAAKLRGILAQSPASQRDLDTALGAAVAMAGSAGSGFLSKSQWPDPEKLIEVIDALEEFGAKAKPGVAAMAAESPFVGVLERVLRLDGVDADYVGGHYRHALTVAAMGPESEAMTRVLISHGVDIDLQDKHGVTACHMAVLGKKRGSFEALVRAGARIDIKDGRGRDPFEGAGNIGAMGLGEQEEWKSWAEAIIESMALEKTADQPNAARPAPRI